MSKLLSFLGGAAKGFIEEVDKSEKYGRETALAQMKQLAENYEKTREENSKLTNELKGVEQWTKTVYGNDATPEQIAFLQGNPVAFEALKKLDNPTKFRLNDIISIVSGNESKAVGAQRVAELPALTEKVSTAIKSKGFFAREFEAAETRAASTAERQFERAYGTSAETMRAALPVQRPSVEGTFDMAKLVKPKSFTEREDEAKVKALDAQQSGDTAAIAEAEADVANITKTKSMFTPEQLDYNKVLSKAKAVLLEPDKYSPEQVKKAQAIFDKNNQLMSREKSAKGDGEKEKNIPAIGALNSHVSGSVQEALKAQFGQQVKDGKITMTPNPQTGEVAINILGMDAQERVNVEKAKFDAASRALSMYVDPRPGAPVPRDVAAALDRYKYSLEQAQKGVTAPPPSAGTATPPAKAAAVTPTNDIKSKVEAAGQKYDPTKWDYRIATDGSVQRKAK